MSSERILHEVSPGGQPSNTPPSNLNKCSGGEDTMDLSFYVTWSDWDSLGARFAAAKEDAQRGGQGLFDLMGRLVEVNAAGKKSGGGPMYVYRFEDGGISFRIMDRAGFVGLTPNVMIHFGSIALMMAGVEWCYGQARAVIESLGGVWVEDKVSRVDLCSDIVGVRVGQFAQAYFDGRCICRSSKWSLHGEGFPRNGVPGGVQTLTLGRGGKVSLNIYDKLEESRHDEVKRAILVERRWGGKVPFAATRVEFRCSRDFIKQACPLGGSFEEYMRLRAGIIEYLCTQWFRISAGPVDRGHTELSTVASLWTGVYEAFQSWGSVAVESVKRVITKVKAASDPLIRQALGCLVSAVHRREVTGEIYPTKNLVEHFGSLLRECASVLDVGEMQCRKILQIAAAQPGEWCDG